MKTILLFILLIGTYIVNAQDIPGWEKIYNGSSLVTKMEFPTEAVGYTLIQPDTLMITTDTGGTWNKVQLKKQNSIEIVGVTDMSFYSSSQGYLGVHIMRQSDSSIKPALIKIIDYGASMTLIYLPDSITGIISISFLSEKYGICVFRTNVVNKPYIFPVMITSDGGNSWSDSRSFSFAVGGYGITRQLQVMDSSTWFMQYIAPCIGTTEHNLCKNADVTTNNGTNWKRYDSDYSTFYFPLRADYIYNVSKFGYRSENGFVFSPILDVRNNIVMDTFPENMDSGNGDGYISGCKNGEVVFANRRYIKEYPLIIYMSKDSCRTWKRYTEKYINNAKDIRIKSVAVNGKNTAFMTVAVYDTIAKKEIGSIIYRTQIDTTTVVKEYNTDPALLQLYPNPVSQSLRWNTAIGTAIITDALGRQLLEVPASAQQANVSGLAIGMYFLTIRNGMESGTKPFVVAR